MSNILDITDDIYLEFAVKRPDWLGISSLDLQRCKLLCVDADSEPEVLDSSLEMNGKNYALMVINPMNREWRFWVSGRWTTFGIPLSDLRGKKHRIKPILLVDEAGWYAAR